MEELDRVLRRLPVHDLAPEASTRMKALTLGVLAQERERQSRSRLVRSWGKWVEPVLLTVVSGAYLGLMIQRLAVIVW